MNAAQTPLAGVVLAGGASRRFGGDKLAHPIDGVPLLDRAIAAVAPLVDVVVVVLAPGDQRELPDGVIRAHDPDAHKGPLAGLVTGLRVVPASVERVVVVAGDMPSLDGAVLARLLDCLEDAIVACLADADGRPRPLPQAVRRGHGLDLADGLLASGERRLRALLAVTTTAVIPFEDWSLDDPDGATLTDVDRPEDLPTPRTHDDPRSVDRGSGRVEEEEGQV